jgi:hypothetical protein
LLVIAAERSSSVAGRPDRAALGLSQRRTPATIAITAAGLTLDDALAWTVDFERGAAGMATIPVSPIDLSLGFDRLVVLGVKSSVHRKKRVS